MFNNKTITFFALSLSLTTVVSSFSSVSAKPDRHRYDRYDRITEGDALYYKYNKYINTTKATP